MAQPDGAPWVSLINKRGALGLHRLSAFTSPILCNFGCPTCPALCEAPSRLGRPPSRPARPSPACIADDLSSILNEPGSNPVQPWQLVVPEPQAFPLLLQESRVRPGPGPILAGGRGVCDEASRRKHVAHPPLVDPCPCISGSCVWSRDPTHG